jgi:hypothetical protein
MVKDEEFINQVYKTVSNAFKTEKIYLKGKKGVGKIVLFDEPELTPGRMNRYKIANPTMAVFDGEKLVLVVEAIPNKLISPKEIVGSIPVCMIARKILINKKDGQKEYELVTKDSKFLLLVVVPDQGGESSQKSDQILDLNEKFKGVLDLESEYSNLKDFAICEISHIESVITSLIKNNI